MLFKRISHASDGGQHMANAFARALAIPTSFNKLLAVGFEDSTTLDVLNKRFVAAAQSSRLANLHALVSYLREVPARCALTF